MVKIYLAARYSLREDMEKIADRLVDMGYDITSQWVYGAEEFPGQTREENAIMDRDDVKRCDMLICFTEPKGTPVAGGGRHSEFGMAVAYGKRVAICGPKEQIFHWLPGVEQFDSLGEMLDILNQEIHLLEKAS